MARDVMKVATFIGTRPEIVKMQPIIKELKKRGNIETVFVHTGQHYDWNMSGELIEELGLPDPDVFLNVRSCSAGAQIARIIAKSEKVIRQHRPDLVLVEGDTNSTLGAALAASRLNVAVGHVEAGCRSFDKSMPEEKNRVLVTDIASLHFAATVSCAQNLVNEGISKEDIHVTGHPIVDVLDEFENRIGKKSLTEFGLVSKGYYLVTTHREENVDNRARLAQILRAMAKLSRIRPVIFPIHPRTKKQISKFRFEKHLNSIITTGPLGYFDTLGLIKHARIVLTDSGGIQQEAALLGTPCLTIRKNTEWTETIKCGVNFLAYTEEEIVETVSQVEARFQEIVSKLELAKTIFGGPCVSKKIVDLLELKIS